MVNRKIAVALAVCLSTATAAAGVTSVSVVAAEGTMAERSNPQFCDLDCFVFEKGYDFGHMELRGIPLDVEVEQVRFIDNDGKVESSGYVDGTYLSLGKYTYSAYPYLPLDGKKVSKTKPIKFLVDYADGSSHTFIQTLSFPLDDAHAYKPKIDMSLTFAEAQRVPVGGVPKGSKISVLNAPEDWEVSVEGDSTLVVSPDRDSAEKNTDFPGLVAYFDQGLLTLSVRYPDGSKAEHALELSAEEWIDDPSNRGLGWEEPTTVESPESPASAEEFPAPVVTVTESAPTVTKNVTITSTQAPRTLTVTKAVTEKVEIPTTVTANVAPVATTVTVTPEAPAPSTVTVTQKVPQPLTVTSVITVTEEFKQAPQVTETVTAPPVAGTTRTVTEKAIAPITVTAAPEAPQTVTVTPVPKTVTAAPEAPQTVTVTQAPKVEENGSSTGSIIALVIGLLGLIGGVGAALVGSPQLRAALPF